MRTKITSLLALLVVASVAFGQLSITATGTPVTEDFTGFAGAGLGSGAGQLDAATWTVKGFSDGDLNFGDTASTGDYAKGVTAGGIFSGGLYAFDDGANQMPWIQPTGSDFTPGSLRAKIVNNTGGIMSQLDVSYEIHNLNNEGRANSFNLSFSVDDVSYNAVPAADFTSVEAEDTTGAIVVVTRTVSITGIAVPDGGCIFLSWDGNDVSGGGSRDEFGLDNLSVEVPGGPVASSFNFASAAAAGAEGSGSISLDVNLSPTADNCSVDVSVTGGTATNGSDYTLAATTTLTFTAGGATSMTLNIPVTDDMDLEADETIELMLGNVTGGCNIGAVSNATVTIENDDLAPFGECENLYFSEYIEGSSSNKALEIYNPTSSAIDLSAYSVQAFNNGASGTPTNSITLSGSLAAGDVYIIANPSADTAILNIADVTSTVTFYNGDDAIVLLNGTDTIDAIGEVGVDPGTNWPVDTGATSEFTLVRKPAVKQGQLDWAVGATEWLVFPSNDFSDLGMHTQDACSSGGCDPSVAPTGLSSFVGASSVTLTWNAVPNSVGCRLEGGPAPSFAGSRIVAGFEVNSAVFPLAILPANTYNWRLRCACTTSPLVTTPVSGTDFFVVTAPKLAGETSFGITPNPASAFATVSIELAEAGEVELAIVDMAGRVVSMTSTALAAGSQQIQLDVNSLDNGLYFLQLTANGETSVQELSVSK